MLCWNATRAGAAVHTATHLALSDCSPAQCSAIAVIDASVSRPQPLCEGCRESERAHVRQWSWTVSSIPEIKIFYRQAYP